MVSSFFAATMSWRLIYWLCLWIGSPIGWICCTAAHRPTSSLPQAFELIMMGARGWHISLLGSSLRQSAAPLVAPSCPLRLQGDHAFHSERLDAACLHCHLADSGLAVPCSNQIATSLSLVRQFCLHIGFWFELLLSLIIISTWSFGCWYVPFSTGLPTHSSPSLCAVSPSESTCLWRPCEYPSPSSSVPQSTLLSPSPVAWPWCNLVFLGGPLCKMSVLIHNPRRIPRALLRECSGLRDMMTWTNKILMCLVT